MAGSRDGAIRARLVVALVLGATLVAVGSGPATAEVTAVKGSAFGLQYSVSLGGGPPSTAGPIAGVVLPAGGSSTPVTNSAPSGSAVIGPATLFTSDQLSASTQGTLGANGSVTSSTDIANINKSGQEVFTASRLQSSCTASESGVNGTTTVTGGTLQTDSGDNNPNNNIADHAPVTINVPTNPAPNTVFTGHLHLGNVTDNFEFIFNKQVVNSDGSITVYALHQRLLGPTAVGDVFIGKAECGVTGGGGGTTTTTAAGGTTTTTAGGGTTTTAAGNTTTTAAPAGTTTTAGNVTTTTAQAGVTGVGGGAYGYFSSVALFGGAAATRGPEPSVTLPASGADPPLTASAPTGSAVYGPATIFTSGPINVSTGGTTGASGSVTSSASLSNLNASGDEVFSASAVSSTCTASATGASGSTTITGGTLVTSEGNPNTDGDETTVNLPANPAANSTYNGAIESVQDTFRYVFNEQITNADGSITVNAAHMYLLGPTAVGELIIGQSRCGATATSGGGGSGSSLVGGGGNVARTGTEAARTVALSALLIAWGCTATYWATGVRRRARLAAAGHRR